MKSQVRVYGKSQSRTALGIVNAYLILYPNSSLADLQKAFPKSLNPKGFTDNIIVPEKETIGFEKQFFEREDELIVLRNGDKLSLVELWTKEDFDAICEHAKQYGIEVAKIEGTKPFEKGSFELEYLEGFTPVEDEQECKFAWWRMFVLFLAVLLLLLLICWLQCKCCKVPSNADIAPVEKMAPVPSVNSDTSTDKDISEEQASLENKAISDAGGYISIKFPDGTEWKIEKNTPEYKLFEFLNSDNEKVDADETKGWINFDKLRFESGKAKLSPECENQLKSVAMLMKQFKNARIKVGGHTDNSGSEDANMALSSERAKVSAEKIISFGTEKDRLSHAGYGSKFPICPENNSDVCKAANRRINVKVTQK